MPCYRLYWRSDSDRFYTPPPFDHDFPTFDDLFHAVSSGIDRALPLARIEWGGKLVVCELYYDESADRYRREISEELTHKIAELITFHLISANPGE